MIAFKVHAAIRLFAKALPATRLIYINRQTKNNFEPKKNRLGRVNRMLYRLLEIVQFVFVVIEGNLRFKFYRKK